MLFRQLFDGESSTYTYLVADEATREAALVDTVREQVDRDAKLLAELGLRLKCVLETHVHADHVTAAGELRRRTGARTYVAREDGPACADEGLVDGDEVTLGESVVLRVIATPGHTAGCLSYLVGTRAPGEVRFDRVLTGDALFVRGCGRTDFQGGDAGTLFDSVTKRLFTLGDDVLVYPGHDYRGMTASTIGEEKRWNPRLGAGKTRSEFVSLMGALNLPRPKRIDEALPANRACGDAVAAKPVQG
jgi:glyoxylase-like metal-dependent hydrolase (beta-lactamase superfamily II)